MGLELVNTPLFRDSTLVNYWRFEGNSNDSKGSNNGSDTGITYGSGHGMFGQGASFPNSNSAINIAAPFLGNSHFTMNVWLRTSSTNSAFIIAWGGYEFEVVNISGSMIARIGAGLTFYGSKTFNDGNWHMLTFVYDGTNVSWYFDGVLDTTTTATLTFSSGGTIVIGANPNGTNGEWRGDMDDFYIFSRALFPGEINSLFTGIFGGAAFLLTLL